ncbi:MAG: hypothetical protein GY719_18285 [bacterium]|nr:hypothetical protein [bacterium]
MRNQGIYDRLFSGDAVMTAVVTDGDEAAVRLDQRYGSAPPTLPDGGTSLEDASGLEEFAEAFSYRQHLDHLLGDLRTVHTGLAVAEDAHQGKLMLLEELFYQRDRVGERLQNLFFKVRHTLETLYSETQRKGRRWRRGFVLASITGATPRTPRRFLQQVEQTERFLREPVVDPPTLELNGVQVDFDELANDLEPVRREYGDLLDAIDRTQKEAQGALVAKNEAIDEYDRVFGWVTRAFESLFSLAGMEELARRIRPSVRRKGRRAIDEEDAPEAADASESAAASAPAESAPADESSSEAAPQASSSEAEPTDA